MPDSSGNLRAASEARTLARTNSAVLPPIERDLVAIIAAWPGLSPEARSAVLAVVRKQGAADGAREFATRTPLLHGKPTRP